MRPLQNYKTYTNLSVLLSLMTLRTRKILSLDIILSWIPRSPFWITEIEGPLLTYDQMSDNDLLSCTNSLVTIMVVIYHRNIPWGPRCLQRSSAMICRKYVESPQLAISNPQFGPLLYHSLIVSSAISSDDGQVLRSQSHQVWVCLILTVCVSICFSE